MQDLLKKLSKIDIEDFKKIDYIKLLAAVGRRPDLIAICVSVLLTLFISLNIFGKHKTELRSLTGKIGKLEKKSKAIETYLMTQEEIKEFWNIAPKNISDDDLVNLITSIATARKIKVESYVPARKQVSSFYERASINLHIIAPKYSDLWLFIHDIEEAPHAIRIDSWTATLGTSAKRRQRARALAANTAKSIGVQLTISAINFKNE